MSVCLSVLPTTKKLTHSGYIMILKVFCFSAFIGMTIETVEGLFNGWVEVLLQVVRLVGRAELQLAEIFVRYEQQ